MRHLAAVAKEFGIRVEYEMEGAIVRFTPANAEADTAAPAQKGQPLPDDFAL
jgi:hypothetical protein